MFIQDLVQILIFVQFITTSINQITFGYYIIYSSSALTTFEIIMHTGQCICIVLETLMPCYFGEKVKTAGDDLAEAIYNVNWYEQNVKFRKYFVLFLQRAQQEQCLKAGDVIPITLQSFVKVI